MNECGRHTREAVTHSFVGGLGRIDLLARVRDALPPAPPRRARVRLVAVGKAAPRMAAGALERWAGRIERALIIAPPGVACEIQDRRVEVVRAAHPVPDLRSVAAAESALGLAKGMAQDLLLALVSGGASALLCAPVQNVSLQAKQEVTAALLSSGAKIGEINAVRRHLSRIKGGGLARAAYPARVLALVASDVIDGALYDIGSGPTLPDPTTIADARRALAQWTPWLASPPFAETLKAHEPPARRQRARAVAGPDDLALAVADVLREEGWSPSVALASSADVRVLAAEYAELAGTLAPRGAIVRAAEPSIELPRSGTGKGGRAGHLAAMVAARLPPGVVFLAGASDGNDGSSGAAGAVVDARFAAEFERARYEAAISEFDTASLHEQAGTALVLEATGLNFADVHVLARD